MKPKSILSALAVLAASQAGAQTFPLFNSSANIDIANIKASHQVHGDMWYDTSAGGTFLEFPTSGSQLMGSKSAVWMSAYTSSNALRAATVMYRVTGSDYWPGPLDTVSTTPSQLYATAQNWAKIWKVNSKEIDAFLAQSVHTTSNTPASILEWPAKGNTHAKGAGGATLSIPVDMAPFVDVNADGYYDPLAGDYPQIKGSQMLWCVFNDAGPSRSIGATTDPLKMEIRMRAYAYKLNTVADNIIFYEYDITNKSTENYSRFRMGVMADFDIGHAFDDISGFDSARRMGIIYNANNAAITGVSRMGGIAIMELPGDAYNAYAPAGSMLTFDNGMTAIGDPREAVEFDRMLRSKSRTGLSLFYHPRYGPHNEHFACDSAFAAGDKRFILASDDLSFAPGQTRKFAVAMILADSTGRCPNMSFDGMHHTADTAYKIYWQPFRYTPPTSPTAVSHLRRTTLIMYPNPAHDMLRLESIHGGHGVLQVFDAVGRLVQLPTVRTSTGLTLNTASLAAGLYTIRYQSDSAIETGIFIKE